MPIFTSILFFFIALALLPLAFRGAPQREARRQRERAERRLGVAARICEASAQEAFGVQLNYTFESIGLLDEAIARGWTDRTTSDKTISNLSLTMGAYLGTVFVRHADAEWQWPHGEAMLVIPVSKKTVSPFESIRHKVTEPNWSLTQETTAWHMPEASDFDRTDAVE